MKAGGGNGCRRIQKAIGVRMPDGIECFESVGDAYPMLCREIKKI